MDKTYRIKNEMIKSLSEECLSIYVAIVRDMTNRDDIMFGEKYYFTYETLFQCPQECPGCLKIELIDLKKRKIIKQESEWLYSSVKEEVNTDYTELSEHDYQLIGNDWALLCHYLTLCNIDAAENISIEKLAEMEELIPNIIRYMNEQLEAIGLVKFRYKLSEIESFSLTNITE